MDSSNGNENLRKIKNAFIKSFSDDFNDGDWFLKSKYDTLVN